MNKGLGVVCTSVDKADTILIFAGPKLYIDKLMTDLEGGTYHVTKGHHDVNVRLLEPQTLQMSPGPEPFAFYSEQNSNYSESITIARVAQRRDQTRDLRISSPKCYQLL